MNRRLFKALERESEMNWNVNAYRHGTDTI